jgi:uncharacterized membrane protein
MLRREDVAIEQVFSWFTKERYLPSLMVRLFFFMVRIIQMIVIVLIGLLSLIPMFALGGFAFYSHNGFRGGFNFMPFAAPDYFFNIPRLAGSFVLCAILFILVVLAATVFTEWFITRYSAVTNIVADTPQIGIGPAIRQSLDVMEGNGWKMIRFYLSFIGWALLIPITFGLILLYLVPYFTASRLLYIEYFRDMHNKRIAGTPSFERPDQSPPDPEPKPEENGPQNPPEQGQ